MFFRGFVKPRAFSFSFLCDHKKIRCFALDEKAVGSFCKGEDKIQAAATARPMNVQKDESKVLAPARREHRWGTGMDIDKTTTC